MEHRGSSSGHDIMSSCQYRFACHPDNNVSFFETWDALLYKTSVSWLFAICNRVTATWLLLFVRLLNRLAKIKLTLCRITLEKCNEFAIGNSQRTSFSHFHCGKKVFCVAFETRINTCLSGWNTRRQTLELPSFFEKKLFCASMDSILVYIIPFKVNLQCHAKKNRFFKIHFLLVCR